jgi:hypothetical protein
MRGMSTGGRIGMATVLALAALGAQGCTAHGCTDIGAPTGLAVVIPASLYVPAGDARVKVCDDSGCASTGQHLGRLPRHRQDDSRGLEVSWDDLDRKFDAGRVDVTVTLADATGGVVAVDEQLVTLAYSYPNGKACDGDSMLGGGLTMRGLVGSGT